MALGKEIGTFSLKSTSMTLIPGTGSVPDVDVNLEGTVTGDMEGVGLASMTFTSAGGEDKSGTYTICARVYMGNGDAVGGNGSGTYESSGVHKWRLRGVDLLSDGSTIAVEGEIDLATRSYTGKIYEWS